MGLIKSLVGTSTLKGKQIQNLMWKPFLSSHVQMRKCFQSVFLSAQVGDRLDSVHCPVTTSRGNLDFPGQPSSISCSEPLSSHLPCTQLPPASPSHVSSITWFTSFYLALVVALGCMKLQVTPRHEALSLWIFSHSRTLKKGPRAASPCSCSMALICFLYAGSRFVSLAKMITLLKENLKLLIDFNLLI